MRCTSAATTPPSESFTTSPGTSSAAGTVFHAPSRRTDAFSASRDFSAARVAWARLSWNSPSAALNTRRPAMIAASTYLPSTSSSTIAASSIHGTGAQNFSSAMRNGCTLVSGIAFGPNFFSRRRASSLVRPLGRSSFAAAADLAGKALAEDGGAVVAMIYLTFGSWLLGTKSRRAPGLALRPRLLVLGMNLVPSLRQVVRCFLVRGLCALPAFVAHGLQLAGHDRR